MSEAPRPAEFPVPRVGPVARLLRGLVRAYQLVVSPWLAPSCRFEPSCSAYAMEALQVHGALRGSWLVLRRLARCQPFCAGGYDPVPEPRSKSRRFPMGRVGRAAAARAATKCDGMVLTGRDESSESGEPLAGSPGRGVSAC